MEIKGTEQELQSIMRLCDAALRAGGLKAHGDVVIIENAIMNSKKEPGKHEESDEEMLKETE